MDRHQFFKFKDHNLFYIVFGIVTAFVVFNFKTVFEFLTQVLSLATPFYIAMVLAFLLNIPMRRIETLIKKLNQKSKSINLSQQGTRALSIAFTLIIVLVILILFTAFIIPRIGESFTLIVNNLSSYARRFATWVTKISQEFGFEYQLTPAEVNSVFTSANLEDILSSLSEWLGTNQSTLTGVINSISGKAVTGLTAFFMSLYILSNKEKYIVQFRKVLLYIIGSDKGIRVLRVLDEAQHYFNSFIGGQFLEACIFMVLNYIFMKIFNLPFPELIAIIAFLFSFVPIFGSFITLLCGIVLVAAAQSSSLLLYIILFICLQQFEGNFVYPKVVGRSVGISGLYVLLGVTVFGNLWGVLGVLVGVPLTALIYALCSRVINISLYRHHLDIHYTKITEIDEFGNEKDTLY